MLPTDDELIAQYKDGDDEALRALIERHTAGLYTFALRLGVPNESVPDVLQDTHIKAWKHIETFDSKKASWKTWLFRIARNTCTDFLRKKKSLTFSSLSLDEDNNSFADNVVDDAPLPTDVLMKVEDAKTLQKIIAKLQPDYQSVLTLYYQEEMTLKEIATVLKKPENTIKSQYRRAREALRKLITNPINK